MFLRNCWYAAGWSRDFEPGKLYPITILDEPVIVYRTANHTPVALQDRCCHRLAPLSMGRLEGENLRCMYHGLKFAPSGRCIEIPGEAKIPPQVKVRSYPIRDEYSIAWIWMGDAASADTELIPDFVGVDDPRWAMHPGRMDYKANYTLINDNLLDLSHIGFLHANSLGLTVTPKKMLKSTVTPIPRGVRIQSWGISGPSRILPRFRELSFDVWQTYDFIVPGVFLLQAAFFPSGTAQRFPEREAVGVEPLHIQFTCQAVTPLTHDRTCYFFAYGPWVKEAELKDFFYDLGKRAFVEDRMMIEAQQRNIDLHPEAKMVKLSMDAGVARFNRIMEELMRAEAQPSSAVLAAAVEADELQGKFTLERSSRIMRRS
jgi:phenylpropionate dioxygenase-like ring-hydroxylating dioxygenase large terminal subunit